MQQKYAEQGLQIIAINLGTEESLAKGFLEKVPAQIPIICEPEGNIASDYQLLGMPSSYLIDKKAKYVFHTKDSSPAPNLYTNKNRFYYLTNRSL